MQALIMSVHVVYRRRLMARAGLLLDGVGRLLMLSVDGSEDTEAY